MTLVLYTKQHATARQNVKHLRNKGLIISQPNDAAKQIERIGYERLRIYFLSRRQHEITGRPFIPDTKFKHIIRLYQCDMKLRDVCFTAVGQFELLFRNSISENLSKIHGSHPYQKTEAFKNTEARLNSLKTFVDVYKSSKDHRAKHYRETYSDPVLPPIWTMKEFLTFGASIHIFKNLSNSLKTSIGDDFGISSYEIFQNWVSCLVDLRNICAHHDRLFNRSFQKQPQFFRKASIPIAKIQKLKAILECLDYMFKQRGSSHNITNKVGKIIAHYPEIRPTELGF